MGAQGEAQTGKQRPPGAAYIPTQGLDLQGVFREPSPELAAAASIKALGCID